MSRNAFDEEFEDLTGHPPFPWQRSLFERFLGGDGNVPAVVDLPTGLGKTSVIAVWLLTLLRRPGRLPRRLAYVVNRRTVVDQTTSEVSRYRERVRALAASSPLRRMVSELGVSTLRGQFADNHEWSDDPSRPAVICGTVDMIGSRLLFGGYRIGFRARPLHAGFLGQDTLLVHDEAHLEPAFQRLIETIEYEQRCGESTGELPWPKLQIMALSATARSNERNDKKTSGETFGLTHEEKHPPNSVPEPPLEPVHHVWRRLQAKKLLRLREVADEKKVPGEIARVALDLQGSGAAVLIFVRTVDDVKTVRNELTRSGGVGVDQVRQLTGTMRGWERDGLVSDPVFLRFLPGSDHPDGVSPMEGTVYLVCTSAGEVGVNLSADHMICDLSTFDSMAQRLGRVNRFGERDDAQVALVHSKELIKGGKLADLNERRERTLELLRKLPKMEDQLDASPRSLSGLPVDERLAAFAPEPTMLPATDILFDRWTLTTIRGMLPGRPPLAPFLHGIAEWEPPQTSVAWRDDVEYVTEELIQRHGEDLPLRLLDDFPLKPHELLSDTTDRIYKALSAFLSEAKSKGDPQRAERARSRAAANVWIVDEFGDVTVTTLAKLVEGERKRVVDRLEGCSILLPPTLGGLANGTLDPESEIANDVADHWLDENGEPRRQRVWDDAPTPTYGTAAEGKPMALVRSIDVDPLEEEQSWTDAEGSPSEPTTAKRYWHWYSRPHHAEDATAASPRPITWAHHTEDVVQRAATIVANLGLPSDLCSAITLAAELHDLGKQREIWQRSIGNPNPENWYAKSGKPVGGPRWRGRRLSAYRHELGSLLDMLDDTKPHAAKLAELSDEMQEVVLHLVAAHHGYSRPHFPADGYDYEGHSVETNQVVAMEAMRRYARLQRRFGRWGLAYLESLLRAADWSASAKPSEIEGES